MQRGAATLAVLAMATTLLTGFVAGPDLDHTTLDYGGQQVVIERDGWGVPHVTAPSLEAATFGVGYAAAQDRLWQLHVTRMLFSGRGAEIFGSGQIDFLDLPIRRRTLTPTERAAQFAGLPVHIQREVRAYVDGINAYVDRVNFDPTLLPVEFVTFRAVPIPAWEVEDVLSFADFIAMAVESGSWELDIAALRARLHQRASATVAEAQFADLVRTTDPDTHTTIPRNLNWRNAANDTVDVPRSWESDARLGLTDGQRAAGNLADPDEMQRQLGLDASTLEAAARAVAEGLGIGLRDLAPPIGSNAQVIASPVVEGARAALTASPQIEYTVPSRYWEFGVHVPGEADVVGMTWPGFPYQIIGRGERFSWTITNSYSDATDVYIETLHPDDPHQYLFDGTYEQMDCRTEEFTAWGVPSRTEEICRTRHGPVLARGDGVAYAYRSARWNRELDQLTAFAEMARADSIEEFAAAVAVNPAAFNFYYADADGRTGYWFSGALPDRPAHLDIRMPRDGRGSEEWLGLLPFNEQPHAIDPPQGWLVNWNNGPSADYPTLRSWPALHRGAILAAPFQGQEATDPKGGTVNDNRRWSPAELDANARHAAFSFWMPVAPYQDVAARSAPLPPVAAAAQQALLAWDGLVIDADEDGYHDHPGRLILAEFVAALQRGIFHDDLSGDAGWARWDGEVWQAISNESRVRFSYDWLNGASPADVIRDALITAADRLTTTFGSDDPADWHPTTWQTGYLNWGNLQWWGDAVANVGSGLHDSGVPCPIELTGDPRCLGNYRDHLPDPARPGYVERHDWQNRGVYYHLVGFGDPRHGTADVSCNVLTPGNHGTITAAGEGPHYRDQWAMYAAWDLKPLTVRPHTASGSRCDLNP